MSIVGHLTRHYAGIRDARTTMMRTLARMTREQGAKYDKISSAAHIEPFVRYYHLQMEQFMPPYGDTYNTFNEFFYRKVRLEWWSDVSLDCTLTQRPFLTHRLAPARGKAQ